jgi:putative hydrolase of the HAD superfamily
VSGIPRLEAVVFDLFHTLVDPEDFRPGEFDRAGEVARALGVEPGPFRGVWEGQLADLVCCADRPADRAVAYARAQGREVLPAVWAEVDDILGRYQDLALEHPRSEVVGALGELRRLGFRLGLLSNAHERDVRSWERSPLRRLIDGAVFSCNLGTAKPAAGAYRAALEAVGTAAGRAAFVADGGSGELAGARRHGFGLVVLVSGPALRSGLRDAGQVALLAGEADLHLTGVEHLPALLER